MSSIKKQKLSKDDEIKHLRLFQETGDENSLMILIDSMFDVIDNKIEKYIFDKSLDIYDDIFSDCIVFVIEKLKTYSLNYRISSGLSLDLEHHIIAKILETWYQISINKSTAIKLYKTIVKCKKLYTEDYKDIKEKYNVSDLTVTTLFNIISRNDVNIDVEYDQIDDDEIIKTGVEIGDSRYEPTTLIETAEKDRTLTEFYDNACKYDKSLVKLIIGDIDYKTFSKKFGMSVASVYREKNIFLDSLKILYKKLDRNKIE